MKLPDWAKKNGLWMGVGVVIGIVVTAFVLMPAVGHPAQVDITSLSIEEGYASPASATYGLLSQRGEIGITAPVGGQISETLFITSHALFLSYTIDNITVTTPGFTLVSMSHFLPYTLSPGSSASITLTITVPNSPYTGPLDISESIS